MRSTEPMYLPTWIPSIVPQPAQDRLLEKQWRRKAEIRYRIKHGRWPEGVKA